MKKILSLILCLSTVSCSSSITTNVNISEIYVLKEEAKININVDKLYFSYIKDFKQEDKIQLSDSTNVVNPVIGINTKGNGLIVWQDKTTVYGIRLKNYQLQ